MNDVVYDINYSTLLFSTILEEHESTTTFETKQTTVDNKKRFVKFTKGNANFNGKYAN